VDYFQRSENLVLVSQPYGIEEAELKRWTAQFGATCTVANDWTYHFPGHTSLFFIEFNPKAKAELDKRARKG
jgi:hypothetical protein